MEPPQDPPTLEYSIPQEVPVTPTLTWVGVLGFLIYGGLALLFLAGLMFIANEAFVRGMRLERFTTPGAIYFIGFSFTTWRAIAAFRGVLRNWRGR
jgi:hypothetical protein